MAAYLSLTVLFLSSQKSCLRAFSPAPVSFYFAGQLAHRSVVVVVTVGSRPKRVEPSGQLAEHCVFLLFLLLR